MSWRGLAGPVPPTADRSAPGVTGLSAAPAHRPIARPAALPGERDARSPSDCSADALHHAGASSALRPIARSARFVAPRDPSASRPIARSVRLEPPCPVRSPSDCSAGAPPDTLCLVRCLPIARQVASWHAPVSWRTIARPSEPRNPSSVLVNPPAAVVSHRFRRPGVSSGAVPVAGDVMRFLVPRRQPRQGLSGTDFDEFLGPQRSPQMRTRCAPTETGCPPVHPRSSTGTSTGHSAACPTCGHLDGVPGRLSRGRDSAGSPDRSRCRGPRGTGP